jgi:hypothetical protein
MSAAKARLLDVAERNVATEIIPIIVFMVLPFSYRTLSTAMRGLRP